MNNEVLKQNHKHNYKIKGDTIPLQYMSFIHQKLYCNVLLKYRNNESIIKMERERTKKLVTYVRILNMHHKIQLQNLHKECCSMNIE
jgi:hypothetical protein